MKISEQADAIAELTKENEQLEKQNRKLEERIKRLEALLATKVDAKSSKKPVFTENYSLDRNKLGSQNSDKKPPRKSTGRKPAEAKEHLVSDTIDVFPQGVERDKCIHHRFQAAWRIVDGKAVYLRYDIRDLADDWEQQHDTIAELIALQTILYIDETGCAVAATKRSSRPKPLQSYSRPGSQRRCTLRLSFFFSGSWPTTYIACSCLLSIQKSNRRTIAANGMLGEKPRFAREPARAKQIRVRNDAVSS